MDKNIILELNLSIRLSIESSSRSLMLVEKSIGDMIYTLEFKSSFVKFHQD